MKKTINIVKYVLVAAAVILTILFMKYQFDLKIENMTNNFLQAVSQNGSVIYKLTKKDFKQYLEKNKTQLAEKVQSVLIELEHKLGAKEKLTQEMYDEMTYYLVKFSNACLSSSDSDPLRDLSSREGAANLPLRCLYMFLNILPVRIL